MRNGNKDGMDKLLHNGGSYRTYEEWKPEDETAEFIDGIRSYRTYEEWKLTIILRKTDGNIVLTVPMRNGNINLSIFYCFLWKVLTVPMRNGNISSFVPSSPVNYRSYRTYEEWKRQKSPSPW